MIATLKTGTTTIEMVLLTRLLKLDSHPNLPFDDLLTHTIYPTAATTFNAQLLLQVEVLGGMESEARLSEAMV